MSLKFCANLTFMFQETSNLLERYALAKCAGFSAVECAFPYDYPVEEVVKAKEEAGVEQILINTFVGDVTKGELGFAAIPGTQDQFKSSIERSIHYAKALGCRRIHVMSGAVQKVEAANDAEYLKNLKYASSLFEGSKIVGLIEPINPYSVPNYYMNSFDKGLQVVKDLESRNLMLMLDIFHLQQISGNLTRKIKELLPYVGHIQIAQVPDRNEPNTKGEIDFRYIFSLLENLEYDGWIGLEYKPLAGTKKGLKWLEEFGITL